MAIVAMAAERVVPRIEGLDVAIALHLTRDSVILGGDEALDPWNDALCGHRHDRHASLVHVRVGMA